MVKKEKGGRYLDTLLFIAPYSFLHTDWFTETLGSRQRRSSAHTQVRKMEPEEVKQLA